MISTATPIGNTDRISGLDVARGFALLGILIMNSTGMALYDSAFFNYQADGGTGILNFISWASIAVYFEGAMRGLFSLLFGAGIVLFLGRLEQKQLLNAGDIHARRMLWLIVFGLINGILLMYPYDILMTYGVTGILLFPFRKLASKWLVLIASILLVVMTVGGFFEMQGYAEDQVAYDEASAKLEAGEELTEEEQESYDDWGEELAYWKGSEEEKAEQAEELLKRGIPDHLGRAAEDFGDFLGGFFWLSLIDAACLILIGMAMARSGILMGSASSGTYWLLLTAGYGVGLTLGVWRAVDMWRLDFAVDAFDLHFTLYQARRVALSIGHVGLIFLFVRSGALRWLQDGLGAVGRMAFTNYLMQSVIQVFIWYGVGLGLHQKVERYEVMLVVIAIWVLQIIFSVLWLKTFRFGPLEWVWRALTYVTIPPIKRSGA
ncbi:MAG: DUF418 domain-containing protein [Pseudomonadota bacterium]